MSDIDSNRDSFLYGLRVIVQKDDVANSFAPWWGSEDGLGKLESWTRRYHTVEFFSIPLTNFMGILGWHPERESAGSLIRAQDKPPLAWFEFAEYLIRQGMIIAVREQSLLMCEELRELEKHLQANPTDGLRPPFLQIQATIPECGEHHFFFSGERHPEANYLEELLENNPTKLYETCFEYRADDPRGPKIGIYKSLVGDDPYVTMVDEGFAQYLSKVPHETYEKAENDLISLAKKRWIKFRNGTKTKDGLVRHPVSRLEEGNQDLLFIVERAQRLSITTKVLDTTTVPQKTEWIINGDDKALKDCVVHYKYEEAKDNVIRYALGLPLKNPSPPPKYIDYSKKSVPNAPTLDDFDKAYPFRSEQMDEQEWARIILNYPLTNGESVHQRYRSLMLVYHPDKHPDHESAYWNQKVRELKDAYNIVAA